MRKVSAHVHRFHESVAVAFLGADGETVYLTQQDARALARLLIECADDISARDFTASQFTGAGFDLEI